MLRVCVVCVALFGAANFFFALPLAERAQKCAITFSHDYEEVAPAGTPSGLRIYLAPGLNTPWQAMRELEVNPLAHGGHELILLNVPSPQRCFWADGGKQYRNAFITALRLVFSNVNDAYGTSNANVIGGISYGGLHAMMGYAATDYFLAWFASLPVTRIDALAQFKGVGDVSYFDPLMEVPRLARSKGLITWGTSDERVNYRLAVKLHDLLPEVDAIAFPGLKHETTLEQVDRLAAWLAKLGRQPSMPAEPGRYTGGRGS